MLSNNSFLFLIYGHSSITKIIFSSKLFLKINSNTSLNVLKEGLGILNSFPINFTKLEILNSSLAF